jgi:long-subunit fatty acid transport protein
MSAGKRVATSVGRGWLLLTTAVLSCAWPTRAAGAGFDTPIVYSARHQGMGGTAIGYVNDPSAMFHNPAGLAGIRGLGVLGDFSLLLARLQASPQDLETARSIESEQIVAPFFLLGTGDRIHEWVTVGAAFYPLASAAAEYEYSIPGTDTRTYNATRIVFLEGTAGLSLNVPEDEWLPGRLSLGAGYRVDYLMFDRKQGAREDPRMLNLEMDGVNPFGYRIGLQYRPIEQVGFGVVYRSPTRVTTRADEATVYLQTAADAEMEFVLPARLGTGVRVDLGRAGVALDVEYAFQSQNDRSSLKGTLGGTETEVENIYAWKDAWTFRAGAEYRLGAAWQVPIRAGYVYDGPVSRPAYPSAFGTPPAPTHSLTAGGGYDEGSWEVNLAAAYRFGSVAVSEDQLGEGCQFCSFEGDYEITAVGLYIDASADLEL